MKRLAVLILLICAACGKPPLDPQVCAEVAAIPFPVAVERDGNTWTSQEVIEFCAEVK